MTQRIGYQGDLYSNSHNAAMTGFPDFIDADAVLVPLVTSANIARQLRSRKIDYGVVALKNSIGGVVAETKAILDTGDFEIIATAELLIHHCLFKHPDAKIENIDTIASHIQALKQTCQTRNALFVSIQEMEIKDTAIGALWLFDGTLPPTTAVICPKSAGDAYNLDLIAENIEDATSVTTFGLIRYIG